MDDTYQIANQHYTLAVAPALGGSVTSFCFHDGEDIMRPYTSGSGDPRDCACFVMVPLAHRIEQGRFKWLQQHYQLSRNMPPSPHYVHGEGWHSDQWKVANHAKDHITLVLDYTPGDWPFAFRAEVTYALLSEGLQGTLRLTNLEDYAVPAGMGFHPYYPKDEHSKVYAHVERVMVVNYDDMMPTDIVTQDPLLDRLREGQILEQFMDNCFSHWEGDCIVTQRTQRLTMRASALFSHLHCYAPEEPFFCAEPVSHSPNVINYHHHFNDERVITLKAGQSIEGSFTLRCERT